MTQEEKCIVTAYTGFLMVSVDTFRNWLKENNYTDPLGISDLVSIPLGFEKLRAEVRDKFLELCEEETNND